ncbi:MAG TPA: class I SAM-dependent methyltransferase [Candidatus Deferrimicrobiaceae bacterium]|jgi:2-polyprenyl-6-hydroxyphenyl methylase/3-demethylubiquinone-9 3-methyltransferase
MTEASGGRRGADTFAFGRNWERFVEKNFSDERVEISRKHLLDFLEMPDLKGKYFLDVGCGSGIHSLAAFRSGAARIVSFDIDSFSVKTTERLRAMAGNPPHWQVLSGSVLDKAFVDGLEPADIVYSWGVLHHTGSLWEAVRNTAGRIAPGGLFYLALYEKTADSAYWIATKQKYNRSSQTTRWKMEVASVYRNYFLGRSTRQRLSALKEILTYKRNRGMAFWTDVRDWVGGWPYEPSTPQEVTEFVAGLGLSMRKVKTGEANVEYLVAREGG